MSINHLIGLIFICISSCTFAQSQLDSVENQKLFDRIISVHNEIITNPKKQVGNFSNLDTTSLPIGIVKEIGNTVYIICIDSAFFTAEGAYFNVYMALDFPGSERKLAFAAKHVQFNPQGVIVTQGSRLQLISEQIINVGPKLQMVFKGDGNNFIEWDCNGYKQAGVSADFVISSTLLKNAEDPSRPVKASMKIVVADLNNIVYQVPSMSPFYVKGAEDFIFNLQNITIDRSEFATPSGVVLNPSNLSLYNNDRESWKGFYAQSASIRLPEKLSRNGGNTEIYASDLLIDDAGLSANFGVNNLFSTAEGKMNDSWGFSISNLQVEIVNNNLKSGSLSGIVIVPPLDNKAFNYSASINENPQTNILDYTFSLSIGNEPISINALKSKLILNPSSKIIVQSVSNKFMPSASLSGSWTVDFEKAKISGVAFQNLTISTQFPYLTSGCFSLVSSRDSSKCVRFPISINDIGMALSTQNQLSFFAHIGLNIGGDNVSFGVNTSVRVITKLEQNELGELQLKYDRFTIDDIVLKCKTSALELDGVISIRNDDPIFGDLFFGSISLKIAGLLNDPFMVSAGFGKLPAYKYWFTDVSIPVQIPIMGELKITSIYGGVQNRVSSTLTTEELLERVSGQINLKPNSSGSVIPFIPDPNMGLTFRAGVGLSTSVEKVFNGDVLLSVAFNSNGGFQSIGFAGSAYMMVNRAERQKTNVSKVCGKIMVSYDNSVKVLDARINAAIVVPSVLNGGLNIKFHIDQNDWYFWLNQPTNRAYVNLVDIFTAQTYFMIGTQIEAIPSPPSYVSNIIGYSGSSIDLNAVGNGSGFCSGLQIGVSFGGEFPKSTDWRGFVQLDVGGGFDVMIFNSENTRCVGSNSPIGVNGYYAVGQVYTYLGGALGARKYQNGKLKNQYNIGSLQIAALLQGKLPKPSYIYGAVGVQCEVLGIIKFDFTADVEFGTNCNFVTR